MAFNVVNTGTTAKEKYDLLESTSNCEIAGMGSSYEDKYPTPQTAPEPKTGTVITRKSPGSYGSGIGITNPQYLKKGY